MTETVAEYLSFMVPPPVPDIPGPPVVERLYPDETPSTALDVVSAKRMLQATYGPRIAEMVASAQVSVVNDEGTLRAAVEFGTSAKRIFQEIEKRRKEIVDGPNSYVKEVNNAAKVLTEPLGRIETLLKSKISDYQTRLELERRKAEEAARLARKEVQKRIDSEAKTAGVEAPQLPEIVLPKPQTTVRTDAGSSYQRPEWKGIITNPALVPREYCEPVQKLINDAVKMGVRDIPGVDIKEFSTTVFQT